MALVGRRESLLSVWDRRDSFLFRERGEHNEFATPCKAVSAEKEWEKEGDLYHAVP